MIDREADLPLTGAEIVKKVQRNDDTIRPTTQEVSDLTGLDGTETVRIRRGKRWAKTTTADIAGGINGGDIVKIKQGKRHVRTTAQSIADLGGPAPYTASAVDFDGGNSRLFCASISVINSPLISSVYWLKSSAYVANKTIWNLSPDGDYMTLDVVGTDGANLNCNIAESGSNSVEARSDDLPDSGAWTCIIRSADMSGGIGVKKIKVYFGEADVTDVNDGSTGAFVPEFNGKSFSIGDDGFGSGLVMHMADFRLWVGVSLLDGAGNIVEATRRLFIDVNGKPVDPAVATAALGQASLHFQGDATTFGNNQGSAGVFTPTGLTNASPSPSD